MLKYERLKIDTPLTSGRNWEGIGPLVKVCSSRWTEIDSSQVISYLRLANVRRW